MQNSSSSFGSLRSSGSASSTRSRSRVTPFTDNKLIPELNVFSPGPGTGKYSRPNSANDITLIAAPAYTIPKMKRIFKISYGEKTPDYYYYPTKERSPAYVMGIKLRSNYKLKTPSPADYIPERSKDFLKPSIQYGSIGREERFNTKFLTVFH